MPKTPGWFDLFGMDRDELVAAMRQAAEELRRLERERDSARDWACQMEQEAAQNREELIDARAALVLMSQEIAQLTGGVIDA